MTVTVRFYEELNDFLPREKRKRDIAVACNDRRSVKNLIESLGVPHGEVDLILANGASVDFSYQIRQGDRISVYPEFEGLDIAGATRLRPRPLREPRFVLDVHLRKLAKLLRLLGFDADYRESRDDHELALVAQRDTRILLSRDRGLLQRKIVDRGIAVRQTNAELQAVEVLERLDLWALVKPFTRCTECNGMLEPLPADQLEQVKHRIPDGVRAWCSRFHRCGTCGRIYWQGSHYHILRQKIDRMLEQHAGSDRNGSDP